MAEHGGLAVIFWGPHSLNTERFARHLKAPAYMIHYLKWKRPLLAPVKYIPMWLKTWIVLLKQRPSAVFVINTPVFAPLCVYTYCMVYRIPFIMVVHGHTLSGRKWGWSRPLQRFLGKRALINLVSNSEYRQTFESWGGNVIFLEESPMDLTEWNREQMVKPGQFNVTVVSTFAGDEPLELVLEAARRLPEDYFYILGDTALADKEFLKSAPRNVEFPGYLKGDAYWNQLSLSQAIMVLTTNPQSLVAGGIEGMNLGKPLLLSRQPTLLEYFTKGAVFVDHSVDSLVAGIRIAQENEKTLARESTELNLEKCEEWDRTFQELLNLLRGAGCITP